MTALEMEIVLQLLLAAGLGAILGWEREQLEKPAGLRTYMLVTMGAALFTIISRWGFLGIVEFGFDPSRVASTVVTGIGFIGAGVILYEQDRVKGLTTAAGLWFAAAIGMAVGVGFYLLSLVATAIALVVLRLLLKIEHTKDRQKNDKAPFAITNDDHPANTAS